MGAAGEQLPQSLRTVCDVPRGILDWLAQELGVIPFQNVGDQLSLGEDDLLKVRFLVRPTGQAEFPIQVVVVANGWKLGRKIVAQPTVEVVDPIVPTRNYPQGATDEK